MQKTGVDFGSLAVKDSKKKEVPEKTQSVGSDIKEELPIAPAKSHKLVGEEEHNTGSVSVDTYKFYLKGVNGVLFFHICKRYFLSSAFGRPFFILFTVVLIFSQTLKSLSDW